MSTDRRCRFPGCARPAEEGDGRGRPPAYCDDPGHNRAAAFRARREDAGEGTLAAAGEGEPVTFARVRAGLLVERVEAAVTALATMTSEVVAELRTLGDVEAVEVELESVSASAEQRAAQARAAAAEADTRRRRAETTAGEAEQLRAEAEAAAEEALAASPGPVTRPRWPSVPPRAPRRRRSGCPQTSPRCSTSGRRPRAQARTLAEDLAGALTEHARVQAELDRAHEALAEQSAAGARLAERVEVETGRAERAEAVIVDLRDALAERDEAVTTLHEQTGQQRTELAQVQVRLQEQVAQREHLAQQVAERDERLHRAEGEHADVRAQVAALTAQRSAEQAAARTAAEVAERTATERVAEVRALYEERLAELRQSAATPSTTPPPRSPATPSRPTVEVQDDPRTWRPKLGRR